MVAVSGVLVLLQLATSFYMLTVYDRVLPSGDAGALAVFTGLVVVLHAAFAALHAIRARMVSRAALGFVMSLDGQVLGVLKANGPNAGVALLDDVELLRRFLTSAGPCAAFDVLWLPAVLAAIFFLHPLLGLFACAGVALLAGLAVAIEGREHERGQQLLHVRRERYVLAHDLQARRRSLLPVASSVDVGFRWHALSRAYAASTSIAQDRALFAGAVGKSVRLTLQSAGFGFAALLTLQGALSPGALLASSLILGRMFACLDEALLHWRGFVAAWGSYLRLADGVKS